MISCCSWLQSRSFQNIFFLKIARSLVISHIWSFNKLWPECHINDRFIHKRFTLINNFLFFIYNLFQIVIISMLHLIIFKIMTLILYTAFRFSMISRGFYFYIILFRYGGNANFSYYLKECFCKRDNFLYIHKFGIIS